MRRRGYYICLTVILLVVAAFCFQNDIKVEAVKPGYSQSQLSTEWNRAIARQVNQTPLSIEIDGKQIDPKQGDAYLSDERELMLPANVLTEGLRCAVGLYDGNRLVAEKNTRKIELTLGSEWVNLADGTARIPRGILEKDGILYVSAEAVKQGLFYDYQWDQEKGKIIITDTRPELTPLPVVYDRRAAGKSPIVRDQGEMGTCWAFAACEALESSLLPLENKVFSIDHMSLNNSFVQDQVVGGDYTMALAYLLSWQGPVLEKDDPYGDRVTNATLSAVNHVQEVQIIPKKDIEKIKEAVYIYGGVQSSLYSGLVDSESHSEYYNEETHSYCYIGTEKINHDVVIVGWDDAYPKSNFNMPLEGDGAFLCQNSWGAEFGDQGYFWVSYYDSNIGIYNISYSRIDGIDNYSNIYQSDLCGWVGQIGYEKEEAYFANVFTPQQNEELKAVGFYATGINTDYDVYVIPKFAGTESFHEMEAVASGTFRNAGFYTLDLKQAVPLEAGTPFAVAVRIRTPGSEYPVAVEYAVKGGAAELADISDGQGYISVQGNNWQNIEEKYRSNLCLKAYTDTMKE